MKVSKLEESKKNTDFFFGIERSIWEIGWQRWVILKRVGAKWHISTPLLFCEMRCILVWRGERTPVTQQLFVSW